MSKVPLVVHLPKLKLIHLVFLHGLHLRAGLSKDNLEELAGEDIALFHLRSSIRAILLPMTQRMIGVMVEHYEAGGKNIGVVRDTRGKRYLCADYASQDQVQYSQ